MKRTFFYGTFFLLVASCMFAQDVRYNFDKDANFSKFKTYKWITIKDKQSVDALTDKQIKAALDSELMKKGLTKVDGDPADLYIGYQAAVHEESEQLTTYNGGYNGPWVYGPGWYGGGWYGRPGVTATQQTQNLTITTGQLDLDMYDSAKHDLVWRGVVTKTIDPNAKPEKREKNLAKAIAKLLKNYPPQASK